MQLLFWKVEASSASQLPSGSQAVACLQLLRPALALPPALPVRSIWGRGRGYQTSVHQTRQLEPVFSAILSGDSLCSGRYTERTGGTVRVPAARVPVLLRFPMQEEGMWHQQRAWPLWELPTPATPPQPTLSSSPNPCNRCGHLKILQSTVQSGKAGKA